MKKSIFAISLFSALIVIAAGTPSQAVTLDAAHNKAGDKPVRSTNGTCVRTKWQDNNDICAPTPPPAPPVPEPVAAPVPAPVPPVPVVSLEERTVYFDFNKSNLNAEATQKVDSLINIIVASKGITSATVVGFADDIGSDDYNLKLSQKRSKAVQDYLDSKVTIPTDVMTVSAEGESKPTTSCAKTMKRKERVKCLANDRRVEVRFNYAH